MHFEFRNAFSRVRPRKLRTRILLAMIMLSVPPIILLGYLSSHISKSTIVDNHMAGNVQNLKATSEVADLLLRNVINMHRLILANTELRAELRQSAEGSQVLDVQTANRLQNVVVSNLIDTRFIDSICLFDSGFQVVCYGSTDANPGIYVYPQERKLLNKSEWFKRVEAANGKEVFFSYNVLQGTNGGAFSSVKLLRDPYDFRAIGLLVINMKKTIFKEAINDDALTGFFVVDPTGSGLNLVYAQVPPTEMGSHFNSAWSEQDMIQQLQREGYLSIGYRNRTTDWTLLHIVQQDSLLQDANRISGITFVFAFAISAVAFILSLILSGSIIRPVLLIKKMIVEWSSRSGSLAGTENLERDDEMDTIGKTFKLISTENQQLTERLIHAQLKEREAELRTLQSQIKPHFLYNTLDTIYWMAINQKNRDIAKITVALSESFKISLNKGRETIPVFKELKHIEHYITIQNVRFNNRFVYEADVAPELMYVEVLKLMLQPLVENAFYHGLEPKLGGGRIKLTGRMNEGYVIFSVTDDGVGIEDLSVTESGYGIGNVRERLALYYGASSSLTIDSTPGVGTRIQIRFRMDEKEGA